MCHVLELSRSSYYKWLNRVETSVEIENHQLAQLILEYHETFNRILGYRRMTQWINHMNHKHYNKKRVHRIMKLLGIQSIIRKKKSKYQKSTPEITAENLLDRNFNASAPNQKWVTDVTEFKDTHSGKKLYLSAIIDLYDRSIVAYEISHRNDNPLVFKTFEKAMRENPGVTPLFHSDRGFQYTSKVFKTKLNDYGLAQSMSRVGKCIDSGPIEGFWGIIKSEMFYLYKFNSIQELKSAIQKYVHFYNTVRLQERFQNQTPNQVRSAALTGESNTSFPIKENKKIKIYYELLNSKKNLSLNP
jgi:putative transposase